MEPSGITSEQNGLVTSIKDVEQEVYDDLTTVIFLRADVASFKTDNWYDLQPSLCNSE